MEHNTVQVEFSHSKQNTHFYFPAIPMIEEHLTSWQGLPVTVYNESSADTPVTPEQVAKTVFRLSVEPYDAEIDWDELLEKFLANPGVAEVEHLIVGAWGELSEQEDAEAAVVALVGARESLPKLRSLFFGDIVGEESEISWIQNTDLGPLFLAFPNLEHFAVRGTEGLSFGGPISLPKLKSLRVETGGMPLAIFVEATTGNLPQLERLELWLGGDDYNGEMTAEPLAGLLSDGRFPALRHLTLANSHVQDDVAKAVLASPLLNQLETLGLGMGILTDVGGQALLDSPQARKLKHLDLHHHYMSEGMEAQLAAAFPSIDLSDTQELEEYGPYIMVSE